MQKMYTNTVDGMTCNIYYTGKDYLVEVSKGETILSKNVQCSFIPEYGMDVLDQYTCLDVAEILAQEIEKQEQEGVKNGQTT